MDIKTSTEPIGLDTGIPKSIRPDIAKAGIKNVIAMSRYLIAKGVNVKYWQMVLEHHERLLEACNRRSK